MSHRPAAGRHDRGHEHGLPARPLVRIGGFDPAYRFYLDDADMACASPRRSAARRSCRLPRSITASRPRPRRREDRMPTDLFDVGRSLAIYLRAHLGAAAAPAALAAHREGERRRLLRYMVSGHAAPAMSAALLSRFDDGRATGCGGGRRSRELAAPDGACAFREDAARASGSSRAARGRAAT
jgi:O-antigen biosynthesis protein